MGKNFRHPSFSFIGIPMKTSYAFRDGQWFVKRYDENNVMKESIEIFVTEAGKFTVHFNDEEILYRFLNWIGKPQNKTFDTLDEAKKYIENSPSIEELKNAFEKLINVVQQSDGVVGWNLNGEVASWINLDLEVIETL